MKATQMLAILGALSFSTAVVANDKPTKVEPIQVARKIPPPVLVYPRSILRQDLFDRNNPNDLRSDYPAPPAQPGQF
jgi:hypothetical protein